MEKSKNFFELSQQIADCTQCALRSSCSQVVVGSGSQKADILFIGEAPGKKEDELGTPFMGASGKMLDGMLSSIQLKRENIYITNIVKCRPPKNRDPLPKEIQMCTPWLIQQIQTMKPKLIITLGRHSMNFFLPDLHISSAHGKLYQEKIEFFDKPQNFYTLYHPAAALYNGRLRETLFSDFAKIPKILKRIGDSKN